jgi:hypothetical protein
MHWFWRGTIAVVVELVLIHLYIRYSIADAIYDIVASYLGYAAAQLIIFIPILIGIIAIYGILTYRYGPRPIDRETRCRKCQYILRGISEPRCPECGEQI